MASTPHATLLSRWYSAVAARSAHILASGPWQAAGAGSGRDTTSLSGGPATLFFHSRFFSARLRRLLFILTAVLLLAVCVLQFSGHSQSPQHLAAHTTATPPSKAVTEKGAVSCAPVVAPVVAAALDTSTTTLLPHIPAKIWQIYLDYKPKSLPVGFLISWLAHSPSYSYTMLDKGGALSQVGRLVDMATSGSWRVPLYPDDSTVRQKAGSKMGEGNSNGGVEMSNLTFARNALQQYSAMPRRVLRADFMRYLVLALEGGIYTDVDTALVKPIREWVPSRFRSETRLIVGLEADASPPVTGTTYEVQFCQWTLASAPDHPTMWTMLERILAKVSHLKTGLLAGKLPDKDVLAITGPAAWTEVVFEHLNQVAGEGVGQPPITWQALTGMREPRLYGDTLVLPIDGFATGVPHSHASDSSTKQTLITHQFRGQWKDDQG